MADVEATPSSSFNLAAYKEPALALLTVVMPPAAIAVRQGKVDLESRHLALSLALYLSFIFYLPAVAHAYWLLYVRDNGGLEDWSNARLGQLQGLWNEHGGVAKAKVDEIAPKVVEKFERARTYTTDKVKYATDKKDEAVAFVTGTKAAVHEAYDDAKEAYASGTIIDWTKDKTYAAVEKVKSLLSSYPRVQACISYIEQRVPLVLEFLGKVFETIRAKEVQQPAVVVKEEEQKPAVKEEQQKPAVKEEEQQTDVSEEKECDGTCARAASRRPSLDTVHEDTEGSDSTGGSPKSTMTAVGYDDHEGTASTGGSPRTPEESVETAEDASMLEENSVTEDEYSQEY